MKIRDTPFLKKIKEQGYTLSELDTMYQGVQTIHTKLNA